MRGKDFIFIMFFLLFGITPAYAGKRIEINNYNAILEDHPRLCGEKIHRFFRGEP